jgi:UDP-MurNAc hydroxylase
MSPSIQHLGHACIQYKYRGVTLTTDPWFYPAFLKSWFPYPDNRGNLGAALDSDYIYISHAHEDHFDREFLKQVDTGRTTLIIPNFRSKYLQREIEKLEAGPAYIVLKHGETTTLPNNIKLTMLIDRSHKEDSALLVEANGHRFLDSNDCELAISDWPKDIDLLACQFSGATWYPQCYNYEPDTMHYKVAEVRASNLDRLCRRLEATGAKGYLPSAGPACFLPPELAKFNADDTIFASWDQVGPRIARRFPEVYIHPYFDGPKNLADYRIRRRSEWKTWYGESDKTVTADELAAHFRYLEQTNKRWLQGYYAALGITSDGYQWKVNLGLINATLEDPIEQHYFMNIPMRTLRAVVDGKASWETALISHRVQLRRMPDVYDLKLMGLLNFGDRPIQTTTMAKQQASNEMTEKNGVEFQRWCPHAGEDLNFAAVEGGIIKCPRHEWCWDATTGECLTGQGVPLKIRSNHV